MNGIENPADATTEMTWEVDGDEYTLVRFTDVPSDPKGMVEFLQDIMGCNRLEAERAFTILMEDGEFIASVTRDIDELPTFEG